jgi:hypothetical protein
MMGTPAVSTPSVICVSPLLVNTASGTGELLVHVYGQGDLNVST